MEIRYFCIYGKMDGMKQFRPLGKDGFVVNIMHAEIFEINNDSEYKRLENEVSFMNENNQGKFELRRKS